MGTLYCDAHPEIWSVGPQRKNLPFLMSVLCEMKTDGTFNDITAVFWITVLALLLLTGAVK